MRSETIGCDDSIQLYIAHWPETRAHDAAIS